MASMGIIPAGTYANRDHLDAKVTFKKELGQDLEMVLFDAQTSGGLLITVREEDAQSRLTRCHNEGISAKAVATVEAFNGTDIIIE